jgi:hypothetical protein
MKYRPRGSRKARRSRVGAAPEIHHGKTRITIRIDDDVLAWFRGQVRSAGSRGYQSLINLALREHIEREPLEATLRGVVREELARARGRPYPPAYGYEPIRALVADADDAGTEYGASLKRRKGRRTRKE